MSVATPDLLPNAALDGTHADWPQRVRPADLERLAGLVALAGSGRHLPVHAPFTGARIGRIPLGGAADVEHAVAEARRVQARWARTSVAERRAVMLRFHDLVLERQEWLCDVMQLESGKARRDAFYETLDAAITARHYGNRAARYLRPERRKGALPLVTRAEVHRHPVGVVGFIAPWNYPLSLAVTDAIPALLAGNACVLKPAEQTSFTALAALELLHEAGLPRGLFAVVTGTGSEVGTPLVDQVDMLVFTGSTATGRKVAARAGQNLIACTMELGGKNSMIVLDDADLDRALEGAVRGSFANSGQLCIAFERLYVPRTLFDGFTARVAAQTAALRLGPGYDYETEMGSLLSRDQLDKVSAHVSDAVAKGARVLAGGRARPDLGPLFFEPTVLAGVTPEMQLFAEETFGPVLAVYPYDDLDAAIAEANDTPYGLNAAVYTRDVRRGREVATRLRAGTVSVNEVYAASWGSIDAPMGGMKASGIGRRHGHEGFLKYTEAQTVAIQHLHPIAPPAGVTMRAFGTALTRAIRVMRYLPGLR